MPPARQAAFLQPARMMSPVVNSSELAVPFLLHTCSRGCSHLDVAAARGRLVEGLRGVLRRGRCRVGRHRLPAPKPAAPRLVSSRPCARPQH